VTEPRTIAVLTTGRQDWGILHSTCVAIGDRADLRLRLLAGGMHLSARHGSTIDLIVADGFEPAARLDWLGESATDEPPPDVQAGAALRAIGAELRANPVDALVLVGDRFETAAAALAATVARIPIVHLHGGEQTLGAFDDALRHAITKLAHLHLVSHEEHARVVRALGEDPATIHVVGAPGLDAAIRSDLPERAALERDLGVALRSPVVVVTVHPATLEADPAAAARAVVEAMDRVPATYVITLPNADPGSVEVRTLLLEAARRPASGGPPRAVVDALGERRYWGLLRIADAMVGNSSSAIVEAPAVDLPAVDVGDRQAGRRRSANVIAAAADADAVADGLRQALDPAFRAGLPAARPELMDGRAGARIAAIIAAWHPPKPPRKAPVRLEPRAP
jgi:UDP-hydrolysing UDP-N-acetyl-D-glucosamine 2-epimerase